MSAHHPTAEQQLKFLDNIQRLLSEGDFTATYKFALLCALADLSVEHDPADNGTLTLPITAIAEKFIGYYWPQVAPYMAAGSAGTPSTLQQNHGGQAEVVQLLNNYQNDHTGKLAQARHDERKWHSLVNKVARVVVNMPLWRLQRIGKTDIVMTFLYENSEEKPSEIDDLILMPGVATNFRHFHGLITNLVQSAWIQQLHRIKQNQPLLGKGADLREFLFGSERASLDVYRPLLTDIQKKNCFYCGGTIKDKGEIDHFIPWSRYAIDLGHNFVLAHKGCNNAKSDYLADTNHLEHWLDRNTLHGDTLAQEFDSLTIQHNIGTSMHITRWAYEQTDSVGGLVWTEIKDLNPLDSVWRSLLN